MRLVCNGDATTDYAAEEVATATEALERLAGACLSASEDIDGYPNASGQAVATLKSWAKKIARYKLHRHLRIATPGGESGLHPIHRDYNGVLELLEALAAGKIRFGSPPIVTLDATFESGELVFSRKARMGGAL